MKLSTAESESPPSAILAAATSRGLRNLIISLLASTILNGVCLPLSISGLGYAYTTGASVLDAMQVVYVGLILASQCGGLVAYGLMLTFLTQARESLGAGVVRGLLAVHVAAAGAGTAYVWSEMIQPSHTFVVYPWNVDSLRLVLGGMLAFTLPLGGLTAGALLAAPTSAALAAGARARGAGGAHRSQQPDSLLRHNCTAAVGAILALLLAGVSTAIFR